MNKVLKIWLLLIQKCCRIGSSFCGFIKSYFPDILIWKPSVESFAIVLGLIAFFGFISIPISFLLFHGGNSKEIVTDYLMIVTFIGTLLIAIAMMIAPYLIGYKRHIGKCC